MAEVIVVIAIIALMAAVAIPNILAYLPRSRLNGAARVVAGDLASARMSAVKKNCRASVIFSNSHSYYIWVDRNNDNTEDADEKQTRDLHPDFHDVAYDSVASSRVKIGFTSRGTGSPLGTFVLENPSGEKRIKVNIAGRISII